MKFYDALLPVFIGGFMLATGHADTSVAHMCMGALIGHGLFLVYKEIKS